MDLEHLDPTDWREWRRMRAGGLKQPGWKQRAIAAPPPGFRSHGAEAYGFRGEVWPCARVAKVIEEEFGVSYHKGHVCRLLKELHWTPQLPIVRAGQRTEQ